MDIKFEDIKKANESIKTTNIKGKEYSEVNQRIKAFRMVYPTGIIETEMLSNENGICIFRAMLGYREGNEIYKLATGTAYEKENSTFINKTSYIENCETSAVGRALGMAGFGIDTSVCSAEEVQNAITNQNKQLEDKSKLLEKFHILLVETETDYDKLKAYYKFEKDVDLTENQLKEIIETLEKRKK